MTPALPKPQARPKKERKPLRRTAIKRGRRCTNCTGTGRTRWFATELDCPACHGTGRIASKQIKRSPLPKKKRDLSVFDKELLHSIWLGHFPFDDNENHGGLRQDQDRPDSILFLMGYYDWHHVCGRRGGDYMMSSPYNALPVPRFIHDKGWINWPQARSLFLKMAYERVREAERAGLYKPTEKEKERDKAFLDYSSSYRY